VEIMVRIFHMLPSHDLKRVMLVCRTWKDMGENPTLWTWLKVKVNSREDFLKLKIARLQLIQSVNVGKFGKFENLFKEEDWVEFFKVLLPLQKLKRIDGLEFQRVLFSFVDPELLVNVLQRCEKLVLGFQLSLKQKHSELLFHAIAGNKSNLRNLYLSGKSIVGLEPQLLTSAICKVREVSLDDMRIQEHMVALFRAITGEEENQLMKLSMFDCNISDIEPNLVGEALNRLEEVSTGDTYVTREQIRAILVRAVGDQSKLKKIDFDMNYYCVYADCDGYDGFDQCEPGLLELAEGKFGKFHYCDAHFETVGNNYNSDDDTSEAGDDDNSEEGDDDNSEEGDDNTEEGDDDNTEEGDDNSEAIDENNSEEGDDDNIV